MTLIGYIQLLEKHDPNKKVPLGLGHPHSWRGSYDEIAFEPVEDTTVGEMLDTARSAINKVFVRYKGGEYLMTEYTPINIDYYGNYTGGSEIFNMLFKFILGDE